MKLGMMRLSQGGAEPQGSNECQTSVQESEETLLPREPRSPKGELPAEVENQWNVYLETRAMPQGWPDVLSRLLGPQ